MNIYEYIDKYQNLTFEEKPFTEIDNLIFSLLSYLDFDNMLEEKQNTIEKIGTKFLNKYSKKHINKYNTPSKDAYKCLEKIINTNRYRNIEILNYVYIGTTQEQFCAITFKINKKLLYISFEGTDHLVSGWKEDFEMAYMYPVLAQQHAINYLKQNVKIIGPKIIVGGHSKGGNLALVSAMELNLIKKFKIKKIYNNDGPGLRLKEFKSRKYRTIEKKLEHIIPYNSIFGIMLRNSKYKVVQSNKKTVLSHSISTWLIQDDKLIETERNIKSQELEKSVLEWLNNHNDETRKKMIENVFKVFEKCEIEDTRDIKKFKSIIKIIKEAKKIDKETKELVTSFINYNFF